MQYTINLSKDEIAVMKPALRIEGLRYAPNSLGRRLLEGVYGRLLELTAGDNVARAMQNEGDKYGHD